MKPANQMFVGKWVETIIRKDALSCTNTPSEGLYKPPCIRCLSHSGILSLQLPSKVNTSAMGDSCCPGTTMAIPAVPTFMCSNGGGFRNGICLPSSCRSRTWQLITCQENCQPSSSTPSVCEPASCQPTCLPATSCVGFVCQPICSCTASYESGTGQSPCLVSSCQPSCTESTSCQANCNEASLDQQSSCQEPVFVSRSCQSACGQSVCCDTVSGQPSCSEVTSCIENSCPPTICAACPCQPTRCQAGSCQPINGEDQLCKSTYYQPICYILKTCQLVPCMPVPCQPSTCMLSSCSPTCCVSSPCQPLHCQPMSSISFICQPVANCQLPCSVNNPCKRVSCGTVLSSQPPCDESTSCNQGGCKSPSCQPACCVTGLGKSSSGGCNCFQPTAPSLCKANTCSPTSWPPVTNPASVRQGFTDAGPFPSTLRSATICKCIATPWCSLLAEGKFYLCANFILSPAPHSHQVLMRKFVQPLRNLSSSRRTFL